jgi:hypothetical protein
MGTMAEDTITLSEINRRLARLETLLDTRLMTLDLFTAEKTAMSVALGAQDHRIDSLEDNQKDINRAIRGAFLGLVIQAGFFIVSLVTSRGR